MPKFNSTFRGYEPTWANACVGDNGDPGYWEYSKGFSRAANLLIESVLRDRGQHLLTDEFIYPVCFNMRHSVELRLKGSIVDLKTLSTAKGKPLEFNLDSSHDIGNIWDFFRKHAETLDSRFTKVNERIDASVRDIAEVDATGQTFRYPISNESQKHLTEVSIINFLNLGQKFRTLEGELDTLYRLSKFLLEEYSLGTFTKRLQRNMLQALAKSLPHRSSWKEANFAKLKEDLKASYCISSRELSLAIKIIEKHYEFAPAIGLNVPLKGVGEDHLVDLMNDWSKMHELTSDKEVAELEEDQSSFKEAIEYLSYQDQICDDIWSRVSDSITPDTIAGLRALFYFANEMLEFSENYVRIYDYELSNAKLIFASSKNAIRQSFFHIFNKTNAMHNIVKSLCFLKKLSLVEELTRQHDLAKKFSWLDRAKSGELFAKANYCGYVI